MESLKSPTNDPLTGFTIGVTAARRSEELITLLERRGATVVHAPAIRIIPLVDDDELRRVTTLLIEQPPDVVVVTTGIGFRGWFEAAHGWDVADELMDALASTRILARGPKARGAVRQVGLCEEWSPESEASPEVLDRLLADGAAGLRIAVQLHGVASEWEPNADICDALTMAGAEVIKVPVYRWEQPEDSRPMDQLIAMIVNAEVDAVSFTSAPAVASMLQRAKALGCVSELTDALREQVGGDLRRAGHGRSAASARRADHPSGPLPARCAGPVDHRRSARAALAISPPAVITSACAARRWPSTARLGPCRRPRWRC